MRIRNHLNVFAAVTVAWVLFWLGGLPDYYQQYSRYFMIVFDVVILPLLWLVIVFVLRSVRAGRRLHVALWLSFYISVPLMLYDFLYCGIYLGYGLAFFATFWYLTAYYILPWLFFPATGLWMDRRGAAAKTGP